jgi:hypothetical protein
VAPRSLSNKYRHFGRICPNFQVTQGAAREKLSRRHTYRRAFLTTIVSYWFTNFSSFCFANPDLLLLFLLLLLYSPFGPWPLFSFLMYTQSVGLLRRMISSPQVRYLHIRQYKKRINAHRRSCLEWDSNPRSQRSSE